MLSSLSFSRFVPRVSFIPHCSFIRSLAANRRRFFGRNVEGNGRRGRGARRPLRAEGPGHPCLPRLASAVSRCFRRPIAGHSARGEETIERIRRAAAVTLFHPPAAIYGPGGCRILADVSRRHRPGSALSSEHWGFGSRLDPCG